MNSPKNVRADKKLGQHFLVDQSIIKKITNDHAENAETIIEVGPGPGALTQFLFQTKKELILVEKDERFKKSLEQYAALEKIIFTDALKYPLHELLQDKKQVWMVSNLPYNISSPLFIKFLAIPDIKYMTLMFQKEVGIKTADIKQKKNSLNCLSHNYFKSHVLCDVPPLSFSPPPKVDSIVVSYTRREKPIIPLSDFESYQAFLRMIFAFKRKKLLGILKNDNSQTPWEEIMVKLGIDVNIRAEAIEHDLIQKLYLGSKS